MLPSQPVDRITRTPIIERLAYATRAGPAEGTVFRPSGVGRCPGVVFSLGVVPLGEEHPQVARMGEALARAGFAALLHWSPAMRDLRLDPAEVTDLAAACAALLDQPYVDPERSGILGACVGGSFALMAAADPRVRDRLAFVSAYAPYSSMWTLARDIAGACRTLGQPGDGREPWRVDPVTWSTFVRSLTDELCPDEAHRVRQLFADRYRWDASKTEVLESPVGRGSIPDGLSEAARAVARLLAATGPDEAEAALCALPPGVLARLRALSPLERVHDVEAPLIHLMHDRYDPVIPVGESRRLRSALAGRAGVHYTELGFRHLDPTRLPPWRLARELPRFYLAMLPIFRQAMG